MPIDGNQARKAQANRNILCCFAFENEQCSLFCFAFENEQCLLMGIKRGKRKLSKTKS